MNGEWMDGWDGWMGGWMDGWMGGWMDDMMGWDGMDRQMDGWDRMGWDGMGWDGMGWDGWMNGMDGWVDEQIMDVKSSC